MNHYLRSTPFLVCICLLNHVAFSDSNAVEATRRKTISALQKLRTEEGLPELMVEENLNRAAAFESFPEAEGLSKGGKEIPHASWAGRSVNLEFWPRMGTEAIFDYQFEPIVVKESDAVSLLSGDWQALAASLRTKLLKNDYNAIGLAPKGEGDGTKIHMLLARRGVRFDRSHREETEGLWLEENGGYSAIKYLIIQGKALMPGITYSLVMFNIPDPQRLQSVQRKKIEVDENGRFTLRLQVENRQGRVCEAIVFFDSEGEPIAFRSFKPLVSPAK